MEKKQYKKTAKKKSKRYIDELACHYVLIKEHALLFAGLVLFTTGVFSFRSDKYCEGNATEYYACTNPTTYYYYPTITIAAVVVGIVLIALWKMNQKTS